MIPIGHPTLCLASKTTLPDGSLSVGCLRKNRTFKKSGLQSDRGATHTQALIIFTFFAYTCIYLKWRKVEGMLPTRFSVPIDFKSTPARLSGSPSVMALRLGFEPRSPELTVLCFTIKLTKHFIFYLVDSGRIELPTPACKASIFPIKLTAHWI